MNIQNKKVSLQGECSRILSIVDSIRVESIEKKLEIDGEACKIFKDRELQNLINSQKDFIQVLLLFILGALR